MPFGGSERASNEKKKVKPFLFIPKNPNMFILKNAKYATNIDV